ncbi:MAG: T9SS C-terminal target domain-containing protein [Bacteroidetes bacterium]|nr:MAG: T9SS C-terminal target domain-containing protein [Bacteroidota bacterium]
MKTLFGMLIMFPLLAAGQCDPASLGTLGAEVSGDMVTLFNDTAFRNCGALYSMEITRISDDTLKWFQRDLGSAAYCLCYFNLSVTVDSLSAGNYTVKAYFQELMSGEVCYIGSVPFTISEPASYINPTIIDQSQSDCLIVGEPDEQFDPEAALKVFPNPVQGLLQIQTGLSGQKMVRITNIRGVVVRNFIVVRNELSIDLRDLAPGIYVLTLQTQGETRQTKFCKY